MPRAHVPTPLYLDSHVVLGKINSACTSAEFTVSDLPTGVGVSRHFLCRSFEKMEQHDGSSNQRELATVATAAIMGQLSSIEILARHRELCGYETLDELKRVLTLCGQRPSACHVVLNGPDTLLISRFEPAVDFLLREVGFQIHKEVVGAGGTSDSASSHEPTPVAAGARSLKPSHHHHHERRPSLQTSMMGSSTVAPPRLTPPTSGMKSPSDASSAAGGRRGLREYVSLIMPRPPGYPMDLKPPAVAEDSADWLLFRRRIAEGLRLIEWARVANTSLLSIKLSDVLWTRAPSAPYGFEVRISWANVLGKEQGELFTIGDRKYSGPNPNVTELCDTKCDQPCSIKIYVYRDRFLGAKLVGKAVYHYNNAGVVSTLVEIVDPALSDSVAEAAKPEPSTSGVNGSSSAELSSAAVRGCIRVEVSSIRHRYTALQEELIKEHALRRQSEAQRRREAEAMARRERLEEEASMREEARKMASTSSVASVAMHTSGELHIGLNGVQPPRGDRARTARVRQHLQAADLDQGGGLYKFNPLDP